MKIDTRPLFGKEGVITISKPRVEAGDRKCDWCAARTFCASSAERTCPEVIPPLYFRPPFDGLSETFSTVRLGTAWSNRRQPGSLVALVELPTPKVFGLARVERVEIGPLEEILAQHAHTNHLMLDEPKEEAPRLLHEIVVGLYGKNWARPERWATMIFCKRLSDAEALRIEKTWTLGRKRQPRRGPKDQGRRQENSGAGA